MVKKQTKIHITARRVTSEVGMGVQQESPTPAYSAPIKGMTLIGNFCLNTGDEK